MQTIFEKAQAIKIAIFDVDGVLTDGSLFLGDDGQEYKAFNSRDGHGLKMLQRQGVEVAIITGRRSEVVTHRMAELGIRHVYQGQQNKLEAYHHLVTQLKLDPAHLAYVGDDLVDLPVMIRVGFAVAVQDAHPAVKAHAHWITPSPGGRGAARDLCELILQAQGTWEPELQSYFN